MDRSKLNPAVFASIFSLALIAIFFLGIPLESNQTIFIPWDGFVLKDAENIIDYNKLVSNSLEYIIGLPDLAYQASIIKLIGNYQYVIRIIPIICSSWIVGYAIYLQYLDGVSLQQKIGTFLLLLLLFVNIPYQWLINDGVMYSLAIQLTYLVYLLLIIKILKPDYSIDNFYRIYFLVGILFLAMLWSFSLVITMTLFAILFLMPFVFSVFKDKRLWTKKFILGLTINSILFGLIAAEFYASITYNNYGIEYSTIEDSSAGLRDATYGSIWGGLYTQMAGLSDWTMYQSWPNRLFGSMNFAFSSKAPQTITVALYFLALLQFATNRLNRSVGWLLIFIFTCLFFSKGNQPPFGFIYYSLLHSYKFFQAIRTPDTKFGLYMVAAVIIINIHYINITSRKWFQYAVIVFASTYLLIALPPLFLGITTNGSFNKAEKEFSYRVNPTAEIHINQELIKYEDSGLAGVVMPGIGNYYLKDGWHGYREYLDTRYRYLLNYTKSKEGPLGDLIAEGGCAPFLLWAKARHISYVVLRLSSINISEYKNIYNCLSDSSSGFFVKSNDGYSVLYERGVPTNANVQFNNNKLVEIRDRIIGIRNNLTFLSILIVLSLLFFCRKT